MEENTVESREWTNYSGEKGVKIKFYILQGKEHIRVDYPLGMFKLWKTQDFIEMLEKANNNV